MIPTFAEFGERPIPNLDPAREKRIGYRTHPLNLSDPKNQEPLVEVRDYGLKGLNYYHRLDNHYGLVVPGSIPDLLIREGILERFLRVDHYLKQLGLQVWFNDGWRPREVQGYFHDVYMPEQIRRASPNLSEIEVTRRTELVWARPPEKGKPVDLNSPPPHATGAVGDWVIKDVHGKELDMGGIFDDITATALPDHFEKIRRSDRYLRKAKENRRLQFWVSELIGDLKVNPREWWHASDGDQLATRLRGGEFAVYSYIEPN